VGVEKALLLLMFLATQAPGLELELALLEYGWKEPDQSHRHPAVALLEFDPLVLLFLCLRHLVL
jgi:hypothetical protein